jgi:hypothetical protein
MRTPVTTGGGDDPAGSVRPVECKTRRMDDRAAIIEVTIGYSTALDQRRWELLNDVFLPEVVIDYSTGNRVEGRDQAVAQIRHMIGDCGPSQHLLGNHVVAVDGDTATSSCQVRAFAAGEPGGPLAGETYELIGSYRDELVRTAAGWRIARRRMDVAFESGNRAVLGTQAG